jgi:RNA polymerase sigma-70 factor, ECF subfamily
MEAEQVPSADQTDADLLSRASTGDEDALSALLERHAGAVRGELAPQIPMRWQSLLSIDDLMQETYVDAFLDIRRFTPRAGGFGAWLAAIGRCNLVDALRMLEADKRGGQRRRMEKAPTDDTSMMDFLDVLEGTVTTASARVGRAEGAAALRRALANLSDVQQQVVQLYDLQGRDAAEVAAAIGRSEGAMFMLRARAHRQLADLLGAPAAYLSSRA